MPDPTIPEMAAWCRQAARLEDATALQASPLYTGVFIDNATRLRAIASALERAERLREALEPFAEIGMWLFARDLPDATPLVEAAGINGYAVILTRGHFKAAHAALTPAPGGDDA